MIWVDGYFASKSYLNQGLRDKKEIMPRSKRTAFQTKEGGNTEGRNEHGCLQNLGCRLHSTFRLTWHRAQEKIINNDLGVFA